MKPVHFEGSGHTGAFHEESNRCSSSTYPLTQILHVTCADLQPEDLFLYPCFCQTLDSQKQKSVEAKQEGNAEPQPAQLCSEQALGRSQLQPRCTGLSSRVPDICAG